MDADGDGKVTSDELRKWIDHVSHKSAQRHAHLKWTDLLADVRREESPTVDTITWDLYKAALISKGTQITVISAAICSYSPIKSAASNS